MCGLTGWIESKLSPNDGAALLRRMNDAIAHRGPDGDGIHLATTRDGRHQIGLAHRRLAIIDPAGGVQPMFSADGQIALIYNGEIYNFQALRDELRALGYQFATTSDTEVLLNAWRAWGVDCLRRLRGMFAFAIWDAGREALFLARDRFGKKPLFVFRDAERLLFASEIKAILAHPAAQHRLDGASVRDYLHYRYVPGPHTMFEGVTKLMPGSYALWQDGDLTINTYDLPPEGEAARPLTQAEAADPVKAFTDLLDESVRLRMISDVPFGAFLSGGLDSSAMVALMSRHSSLPVNTFSVGFHEAQFDETAYARDVARRFGANHNEWRMRPEDVIRLLPETIHYRDAPMTEPTDVAMFVLARQAAQSVKMVLTGEGADEFLAGYPKYKFEPWVRPYQRLIPAWLHDHGVRPLAHGLPAAFYRVTTVADCFGLRDDRERLPRWFGSLNYAERDALASPALPRRAVSSYPFAPGGDVDALRRCLYFDQTSWLPDNLLERGDRMTMAASIEARMPFMDQELAAFAASLPRTDRIRGNTQKWLLRQAMQPILPADILTRRKIGFRVPVSLWFRSTLREYVRDHLLGPNAHIKALCRPEMLEQKLAEHEKGRANHEKLIWGLLNLELFQKEYGLGL